MTYGIDVADGDWQRRRAGGVGDPGARMAATTRSRSGGEARPDGGWLGSRVGQFAGFGSAPSSGAGAALAAAFAAALASGEFGPPAG